MLVDTIDLGVPATYVLWTQKEHTKCLIHSYLYGFCLSYKYMHIYQAYDNWP